ncbi:MAG: hypothetical protein DHS80DRAFT_24166 [Piptocephalis tieghemiana]|nr:MAG: hypothetical protein DHS80DRAFT_24166 [Piptocephalis tieghemiana]
MSDALSATLESTSISNNPSVPASEDSSTTPAPAVTVATSSAATTSSSSTTSTSTTTTTESSSSPSSESPVSGASLSTTTSSVPSLRRASNGSTHGLPVPSHPAAGPVPTLGGGFAVVGGLRHIPATQPLAGGLAKREEEELEEFPGGDGPSEPSGPLPPLRTSSPSVSGLRLGAPGRSSRSGTLSSLSERRSTVGSMSSSSGGGLRGGGDEEDVIPTAIVIKNIPFAMKRDQLIAIIDELQLPQPYALNYHFENGAFRGLAFANFRSSMEADLVVNGLEGHEVMGRKIKVEYKKVLPAEEVARKEAERRASIMALNDRVTEFDLSDPATRQLYEKMVHFRDDRTRFELVFAKTITGPERKLVRAIGQRLGFFYRTEDNGEERFFKVARRTSGSSPAPPAVTSVSGPVSLSSPSPSPSPGSSSPSTSSSSSLSGNIKGLSGGIPFPSAPSSSSPGLRKYSMGAMTRPSISGLTGPGDSSKPGGLSPIPSSSPPPSSSSSSSSSSLRVSGADSSGRIRAYSMSTHEARTSSPLARTTLRKNSVLSQTPPPGFNALRQPKGPEGGSNFANPIGRKASFSQGAPPFNVAEVQAAVEAANSRKNAIEIINPSNGTPVRPTTGDSGEQESPSDSKVSPPTTATNGSVPSSTPAATST